MIINVTPVELSLNNFTASKRNLLPVNAEVQIKIVINQPPIGFVKGEAKTLGQLAEKNTKKMGRYELDDRRAYQNAEKKEKKKDWWEKSGDASKSDINKMSKSQKAKYIRDGKK